MATTPASDKSTPPTNLRNVVAQKAITIRGIDYSPGDPVDVSDLPDHKVSQMLNQRILRPSAG